MGSIICIGLAVFICIWLSFLGFAWHSESRLMLVACVVYSVAFLCLGWYLVTSDTASGIVVVAGFALIIIGIITIAFLCVSVSRIRNEIRRNRELVEIAEKVSCGDMPELDEYGNVIVTWQDLEKRLSYTRRLLEMAGKR